MNDQAPRDHGNQERGYGASGQAHVTGASRAIDILPASVRPAEFAAALSVAAASPDALQPDPAPRNVAANGGVALPMSAAEARALAGEFARAAKQYLATGTGNLSFRLNPPELGELRLRIRVGGGTARVEMVVERREALDLLRSQIPDLAAGLRQQGLTLGDVQVSVGGGHAGQHGAQLDSAPDFDAPGDGRQNGRHSVRHELHQRPSRLDGDTATQARLDIRA